jgi:hypothetical protein
MSSLSMVSGVLAILLMASGAALAADPPPARKAAAPAKPVKAVNCGELPRGGKAYRECINAEAQRDPREFKPAFSSR